MKKAAIVIGILILAAQAAADWFAIDGNETTKWQDLVSSLAVSPTSYTFDNTTTGQTRLATFTVSNSGNDIAEGITKTVTGTGSAFRLYSCPVYANLSASKSRTCRVAFSPAVQQTYSGSFIHSWPNRSDVVAKLYGTGVGGGGVSPDFSWTFETAQTCEVLFTTPYGTRDCADTTHPFAGTYDAKFSAGAASGVLKVLAAGVSSLWIQGSIYRDNATPTAGVTLLSLADGNSTDVAYIQNILTTKYWRIRNVVAATNYDTTTAMVGQAYRHFRFKIIRSDTVGSITLWLSSDGTNWTQVINQTGIDTSNGGTTPTYSRIIFGRNNGSNLPEDWYYDNLSIWTADPGW